MRPRLGGVHAELLGGGFVGNALGLYVVMIGSYLLPIATLVYLASLLGPRSWGSLAFMQAFAGLATLVVGYGFNFSATREVARFRDDAAHLADLLGGVLGAKVVLAGVALVLAVSISSVVPQVREQEKLLWPAMLWGLSVSFTMGWYYQGLEQMAFVARWETLARALSLAGILLLVRSAGDTWKVLVIQGVLLFGAVIVEMVFAYRNVAFRMPTPRLVWRTLRLGWSMFLFQGVLSVYTVGNGFIVGLLASPVVVGYYVGGERIGKTLASLLYPITQALFPRISHLAARARDEPLRDGRGGLPHGPGHLCRRAKPGPRRIGSRVRASGVGPPHPGAAPSADGGEQRAWHPVDARAWPRPSGQRRRLFGLRFEREPCHHPGAALPACRDGGCRRLLRSPGRVRSLRGPQAATP